MKKTSLLMIMLAGLGLTACNENDVKDRDDVNRSVNRVQNDNASIEASEDQLEADRAEKAAAKARGDTAKRASSSLKIGADHVAVGAKKAKKKVDETVLEENKKDLNN
jgi:hypothetical protein